MIDMKFYDILKIFLMVHVILLPFQISRIFRHPGLSSKKMQFAAANWFFKFFIEIPLCKDLNSNPARNLTAHPAVVSTTGPPAELQPRLLSVLRHAVAVALLPCRRKYFHSANWDRKILGRLIDPRSEFNSQQPRSLARYSSRSLRVLSVTPILVLPRQSQSSFRAFLRAAQLPTRNYR